MHDALSQVGEVSTLVLREGHPLAQKIEPCNGVVAEIGYPDPSMLQKYRRVRSIEPMIRALLDLDAYDVVVGRYLGPLLALPPFRGRAVVDADDAYYRYPAANTAISGFLAATKTHARLWVGQRALRNVDHAWFCSQRDQELFTLRSASVLPNVVSQSGTCAESMHETGPVVLIVGALWYRPNREAIERFLRSSWPEIRRQVPDARFRVVGAAPPELRQEWAGHPGVECPGFVDDLSAEYRLARLTVVPVESGGGTQIKALESLAHGRVPVVSSFVASGFAPHLLHGKSLWVADQPDEIVGRVTEILKNPAAAVPLARCGQEIVREIFSQQRFTRTVQTTLANITMGAVRR